MIPFPATIRLDDSDTMVFERAAEPGEWAIPGSFVFAGLDPGSLTGKRRQAFASGFLGLASFGWSTLVTVAEMREAEYATLANSLAAHFVARYGAPDIATALPAARQELEFAVSLCEHPADTVIAIERHVEPDGIRERFRVVRQPPVFEIVRR